MNNPSIRHSDRLTIRRAFTLIELLVVISIIALLIALLLPALSHARTMARSATGLSALRQTQVAYLSYADEHSGYLLVGYEKGTIAYDRDGKKLYDPIPNRYPWRIIPYLGWNWKALYYDREPDQDYYSRSIYPRFGLNSWFLGGDENMYGFDFNALHDWGPFYARRIEDCPGASRQIVFADSVYASGGQPYDPVDGDGFYRIEAPNFNTRGWDLDDPKFAKQVGYIAERWNGRATVTYMDGHSASHTIAELDDMRMWAPLARTADYVVSDGR